MKTLIIVQARLNSSRFANKVLKKINKKTIIEIIFKRLQKVDYLNSFKTNHFGINVSYTQH